MSVRCEDCTTSTTCEVVFRTNVGFRYFRCFLEFWDFLVASELFVILDQGNSRVIWVANTFIELIKEVS